MADGFIQEYFQIRSGDTVGLDADSGWAADENTNATIGTGVIFRIRFKVREIGSIEGSTQFKIQAKFNTGIWGDLDIMDDLGSTATCVFCLPSSQFSDGDAITSELLTSDAGAAWENGDGVAAVQDTGNILTAAHTLNAEETEFEYCIMITGFFYDPDSAFDQVQTNDTIEFRLVESDGTVFPNTYTNPVITVSETAGFIGATSIEAQGRVMHFDGNDNLYILCEDNGRSGQSQRLVIKSTDRGDTWRVMDDANRPTNDDWEAGDMQVVGTVGYMGSQLNNDVYHDTFRFSDDGSNPDTWGTTDEAIRTGVTRDDQVASIVRRSDGSMVAFWQEQNTDFRIRYSIKNGSWSAPADLDTDSGVGQYHVYAVLGASDKTHIFYGDNTNGYLYHKSLASDDSLGAREQVHDDVGTGGTDEKPILGAIYYDASGTERIVVAFRDESDGLVYTSKIDDDGSPSTPVAASDNTIHQSGIGNRMVTGDLVNDGSDLYIVYADVTNQEIYLTKSVDYGSWDTDSKILASVECDVLRAFIYSPSVGGKQLGIHYEDGSNAANGFTRFYEYEIQAATGIQVDLSGDNEASWAQGVKIIG
jgi:hypothetical protein